MEAAKIINEKVQVYRKRSDDQKRSLKRAHRKTISEIYRHSTVFLNKSFKEKPIVHSDLRNSELSHKSKVSFDSETSQNSVRNLSISHDFRISQIYKGKYKILEQIGEGAFSKVYKILDLTENSKKALKIVNPTKIALKAGQNESKILSRLKYYPTFVNFQESFFHNNQFCMILELLDIDLYSYLQISSLPLEKIRKITNILLLSLINLEKLHITHGDLKPENIFFTDSTHENVKIGDFGSSFEGNLNFPGYIQSRYYRAPEVLLKLKCDHSIDMWSLGCILAELKTGLPLFRGKNSRDQIEIVFRYLGQGTEESDTEKSIRKKNWICEKIGENGLFNELLYECLNFPKRISPFDALNHPWLVDNKKN